MGTTSPQQPDLTIVIPAYHEGRRIGAMLDELATFLKQHPLFKTLSVEVLVVAADTPDKTHVLVISKQRLFKQLLLLKPGPKAGKGRDVQYGMLRATGKVVVFMDADLATPLHHLVDFYQTCLNGNDLVVGTRNPLKIRSHFLRTTLSNIITVLFRLTAGVRIEDSQCGFKMFSERACKLCFSKLTIMGWGFDMEVLVIARQNKLRIRKIRLNDWQSQPYSTFDNNLLQIIGNSLRDLYHIAVNRARGVYLLK